MSDYIRKLIDTAPPLTPAQRDRLAVLLRPAAMGGDGSKPPKPINDEPVKKPPVPLRPLPKPKPSK